MGFIIIGKDGRDYPVRDATSNDAERVMEFFKQLTKESERFLLTNLREVEKITVASERAWIESIIRNGYILVTEDEEGEIVSLATLQYFLKESQKHIAHFSIGILQKYQRLGIGRNIMEHLKFVASMHGKKRCELFVLSDNYPAIALYEKVVFVTEGKRIKSYFYKGEYKDEISMSLWLD